MQMSFRGKVESGLVAQDYSEGRYWTAVRIPFNPVEVWPERRGLSVRGTINDLPFRSTLFGSRAAGHLLLVNKIMQKKAKIAPGSIVTVVIEPDLEDRSATPPPELAKLLRADRSVKKWYEKLNYSSRRYIADAVDQPKSADARQRRAEHWVETMMLTMEGEIEPPPVLQIAFRRQPLARVGWEAMTPIQRRNQLFGIFQCKGPEARAKRTEWAVAEAIKIANRIANRKTGTKTNPRIEPVE